MIKFTFTEGSPEPFTIYSFEVAPFPVLIAKDAVIEYSIQIGLNELIPIGSYVNFTITKLGIIPIKIPCYELDLGNGIVHYGSWLVLLLCLYKAYHPAPTKSTTSSEWRMLARFCVRASSLRASPAPCPSERESMVEEIPSTMGPCWRCLRTGSLVLKESLQLRWRCFIQMEHCLPVI